MPDYTIDCPQCGEEFERFNWGEIDDCQRVCPRCGNADSPVKWVIERDWGNVANFGCGCGGGG